MAVMHRLVEYYELLREQDCALAGARAGGAITDQVLTDRG